MTPRLRNLLRQASRVAESGKRTAAEQLYREIIDEAPELPEAWVGLGTVLPTEAEQREAFDKALGLDPNHEGAKRAIKILNGELVPEEQEAVVETEPVRSEAAVSQPSTLPTFPLPAAKPVDETKFEALAEDQPLVCYRHPDTETNLRCNRCNRPICVKCANRTSVGYRCPECLREIEAEYFNAKSSDYILASAVAFPLSLVAGYLITLFGGGFGFFFFFIVAAVGSGIGTLIARLTFRAIGRRRGRYMPRLIAGLIVAGGLLPALFFGLVALMFGGGFGGLTLLLMPGIYSFVAGSAAYYFLR